MTGQLDLLQHVPEILSGVQVWTLWRPVHVVRWILEIFPRWPQVIAPAPQVALGMMGSPWNRVDLDPLPLLQSPEPIEACFPISLID